MSSVFEILLKFVQYKRNALSSYVNVYVCVCMLVKAYISYDYSSVISLTLLISMYLWFSMFIKTLLIHI